MTLPEVVRIVVLIVVLPVFLEVLDVLVTVVPFVSLLIVDRLDPVFPDRKIVLVAMSPTHVVDASCFFSLSSDTTGDSVGTTLNGSFKILHSVKDGRI